MRLALASLLAAATAASASAQSTRQTTVDVANLRPFVARGAAFRPHERVFVRLASGRTWARATVAGPKGAFMLRFPVALGRCDRFTLQAFGSQGSRARFHPGIAL